MLPLKTRIEEYLRRLQDSICSHLESLYAGDKFIEDEWTHKSGGGGKTRILQNGTIFEKAGVNLSAVTVELSDSLAGRLHVQPQKAFATGVSLVAHPLNPFVPIAHMNVRYLELAN